MLMETDSNMKIRLNRQEDFSARSGQVLFQSEPLQITKERIQAYCRSLDQLDWFHFDEARCTQSEFGALIAPGTLSLALIHSTYFRHVELIDLKALFIGADDFRVMRPIKAGEFLILNFRIGEVIERHEGFRVSYDFEWLETAGDSVTAGTFLVRYWPVKENETS